MWQEPHETREHHEIGLPLADPLEQRRTPLGAAAVVRVRHGEGRDSELRGVGEAVGVAIGSDGHDARGEALVGLRLEKGTEV